MEYPKSIAACVDLFYDIRSQRLALERSAKELGKQQDDLEEYILQTFTKSEMEGCKGKVATASITRSLVPTINDYAEFAKYILASGSIDLLQRRPSSEACKSRWEAGEAIPGVEPYTKLGLSVVKHS